jgi:hypothetical protein
MEARSLLNPGRHCANPDSVRMMVGSMSQDHDPTRDRGTRWLYPFDKGRARCGGVSHVTIHRNSHMSKTAIEVITSVQRRRRWTAGRAEAARDCPWPQVLAVRGVRSRTVTVGCEGIDV